MMCIAYAQTADPTGAYFTYAFTLNDSNDYEKFGIWPDGLYMSVFEGGGENGAYVFDRATMVTGGAATFQYFGGITDGAQPRGMRILPSDWDGTTQPPAGAPNYFVQSLDGAFDATNDRLEIFEAHVDWGTPANSTFTNVTDLNTNAFSIDIGCTDDDSDGAFRNCVPPCNQAGGKVTCEVGTMNNPASVTITITVTPTAAAVPSISNTASVTASNFDQDTANNSDTEITTVSPSADLSVVKACVPDPMAPGGLLNCSLEVTNAGPSTATSVVVIDNLAENTELQAMPSGGGFTCVTQAPDPEITCTKASQPIGNATINYTLFVSEDSAPGSSFQNTANVSAATQDPNNANNQSIENTSLPACTITGTAASETIDGTSGDDVICALGGDDSVSGLGGHDILIGGSGKDSLEGDAGDDTLVGGDGDDKLAGGDGDDRMFGGPGRDRLTGNGGNDVMFGRDHQDSLSGGPGNDDADGGPGVDSCTAETTISC